MVSLEVRNEGVRGTTVPAWRIFFPKDVPFPWTRREVQVAHVPWSDGVCCLIDAGPATEELEVRPAYPHVALKRDGGVWSLRPGRPCHLRLRVGDGVDRWVFFDPPGLGARPEGFACVEDFGIRPDPLLNQTERINRAIAARSAKGGGGLWFPPGEYRCGTIQMASGVPLHLDFGATLRSTMDLADYPEEPLEHLDMDQPPSLIPGSRRRQVAFRGVEKSGLRGLGTLDGGGSEWRRRFTGADRVLMNLVWAVDSRDLRFEGVTLADSEFWISHLLLCDGVTLDHVRVLNEIPPRGWDGFSHPGSRITWNNADGVNPDSSNDVTVTGCLLHTGDDCLPVKNTGAWRGMLRPVKGIVCRDTVMATPVTAMKIGTETRGTSISEVHFEDIQVLEAGRVIGLEMKDGARAEDISFRGIEVEVCNRPFDLQVLPRQDAVNQTVFSSIEGVRLERVRIHRSARDGAWHECHVSGLGPGRGVRRVRLFDLTFDGKPVMSDRDDRMRIGPWVEDLVVRPGGEGPEEPAAGRNI